MPLKIRILKTTSLIILFFLAAYCSPIDKYKNSKDVKAWENDIRQLEHLDSIENYSDTAILFTGSSSIRLWDSIQSDMKPFQVIKRGYGGARLSDYAVFVKRIVHPHKCKAIVIFIANDITGDSKDKSPDEVLSLFKYMVKEIRDEFSETPLFWIQLTPTNARWKVWGKIKEANEKIKAYCKNSKSLYFVETEKEFLGKDGLPISEYFKEDKLHPNRNGYKVWARIIKKNLNEVLK